jgi:hypothetical protein
MSSIHNNGITARPTLAGLKASWHNTDTSDVFNGIPEFVDAHDEPIPKLDSGLQRLTRNALNSIPTGRVALT